MLRTLLLTVFSLAIVCLGENPIDVAQELKPVTPIIDIQEMQRATAIVESRKLESANATTFAPLEPSLATQIVVERANLSLNLPPLDKQPHSESSADYKASSIVRLISSLFDRAEVRARRDVAAARDINDAYFPTRKYKHP